MSRLLALMSFGLAVLAGHVTFADTTSEIPTFNLPIGIKAQQSEIGYRFLSDDPVRNPEVTSFELFATFTVEFMALSLATDGQANKRSLHAKPIAENLMSLCTQSYQPVLAAVREANIPGESPALKTMTDVVARFEPERYQITVEVLPQTLKTATYGKLVFSQKPYSAVFEMTQGACKRVAQSVLKVAPPEPD